MLCDKCGKREADLYYKQIVNGEMTEMHLCPTCAGELGVTAGMFSGDGLFSALFGAGLPTPRQAARCCPLCGSSFEQLVSMGKAGCPECYQFFASELAPSIESIHGAARHVGRLPGKPGGGGAQPERESAPDDPIAALSAELQKAVEAQEYERAAELRDEIKKRKEESENG